MVKRNAGQPEQSQEGKGNREIPAEDPEDSEEDTEEGGEDEDEDQEGDWDEEPDPRLSLPERIRQAMSQHDRNEKVFVAVGRKLKDEPRPTREFSFHIEEDRFHLVPDEIAKRCVASGPGVVDFVVQYRTPKGHFIGQQSLSIGGTFVPPKRDVLTPGGPLPLPTSEPGPAREPVRDARDEELETLRERLDEQDARLQRLRRKRLEKSARIQRKREQRRLVAPLLSQLDGLSARLESLAKANLAPPPAPPKDPTEEAKKIIALMREDESGSSKAVNALRKELEEMRSAAVANSFKSELRDRDRVLEKLEAKLEALEKEKHEEKPKKDDFASTIAELRKAEAMFNAGRPAGERSAAFGRLFDRIERKIEGPLGDKLELKLLAGLDAFLGTAKPPEKTPASAAPSSGSAAPSSGAGEPAPTPAPEDVKAFSNWIAEQIKAGFVAFDKPDQIREPLAKWPTLLPRFANAPTRVELVTLLVDVLGYPRETIESQVDEQKWPLLAMLLETLRKTIAAARASAPAPTPSTTTAAGDAQPRPTPPAPQADAARREFGSWLLKHLQAGCVDLVKPAVVHPALERWPDHVKALASVEDRKAFLDLMERLGFERVALESSIHAQLWVQLAPAFGFHAQVVGEKLGKKFGGEKMIPPPPEFTAPPKLGAPVPVPVPAVPQPPAPPPATAAGANGTAAT